jgi:hypothetical protein
MTATAYEMESGEASLRNAEEKFRSMKEWMDGPGMERSAGEVERKLEEDGRELLRLLMQAHINARSEQVVLEEVIDNDGMERTHKRKGMTRHFLTTFGVLYVVREGYGGRGLNSLFPLDANLELPTDRFSYRIREISAIEASRGSYDEVVESIERYTGQKVGKRQVEQLVIRASNDFEEFYQRSMPDIRLSKADDLLILTCDGKGIVMHHDSLRPATQRAAKMNKHKLRTRLSQGEKRNRKRDATVCSVYNVSPWIRTVESVVEHMRIPKDGTHKSRPKPQHKRVWADVVKSRKETIGQMFDEAEQRDPNHKRQWVILVDGSESQLRYIKDEAKSRGITPTIIIDFVHVLEYIWKAAYVFHKPSTQEAEDWVYHRLLRVFQGAPTYVAAGMRRSATCRNISKKKRKNVDKCANYLKKFAEYMEYQDYLTLGFPIATGVIEGACRHLIKDRMDLTGARWKLDGAEAILRLRALRSSGDFERYWAFHLKQERLRNHDSQYADNNPPALGFQDKYPLLRLVE